jgi:hypothetical protein
MPPEASLALAPAIEPPATVDEILDFVFQTDEIVEDDLSPWRVV